MDVPLCDLTQQYLRLKDEIDAAMISVAQQGRYILGPQVEALEREIADYCQCRYAIGVNSGTDALYLSLLALGIGPGDEVITTPFTFIATSEAIRLAGARPVFVDIDPRTYNLDVGLIEQAISPRTKAILPVHLYGQPCQMHAIMECAEQWGLDVVEDCAQAIGASYGCQKVGSFGTAGCLSFFPSKNLGCFGDGGMVVTDSQDVYERVESLRRHGGRVKYHHEETGVNSRLDELQAAILRTKLKHLDRWNERRCQHAYRYDRLLEAATAGLGVAVERPNCGPFERAGDDLSPRSTVQHVYHQYTVSCSPLYRDALVRHLREAGVGCAIYYPVPLHLQEVNIDLGYRAGDFPQAERAAERCLSLPMFPELSETQQDSVVDQLLHFVEIQRLNKLSA